MEILFQLLGVAYFVFALLNLRWAVLLLPLFFSAYLVKFDVQGIPFPLIEVFIYTTFFAWILTMSYKLFKNKIVWKQIVAPFKKSWWIALLGLFVAAVISMIIAPQSVVMLDGNTIFYGRKVALGILKSWIVAPIMMFMLFAWVIKTEKDLKLALESYVASAVFLAAWGVYQVLTKQYLTPDMRASGPFNSANYLALYITPALFYSLARLKEFFVVREELWLRKILQIFRRSLVSERSKFFVMLMWAGAFLFLLFGLLFTKSYAAFLAFFVACVLWLWFQVKNSKKIPWKKLLIAFGVVLLIVAALIVLDPLKWDLFFQLTTRTSSGVRVEIYTIATKLLLEHPLLGIGLGMFPAAYQLHAPRILGHLPYELNMLHPHNVFLAFWLNLGLLGLWCFLWILKVCFQKAWRQLRNFSKYLSQSLEWFHSVGLLMLIIALVHGFVDTSFFKNDLALLFWLIVAVIMFPLQNRE